MSWMQMLCDVYETATREGLVGKEVAGAETLLPIFHTTVQAKLEITVTPQGDFVRAEVIDNKEQQTTIIPCTEEAATRSSGIAAYPFSEKIRYVAGDCGQFLPLPQKARDTNAPFCCYLETLGAWCESGHAHEDVLSWYRYVQKRSLLRDLIDSGLLLTGEDGRVLLTPDPKPPLYRAVTGEPTDAFVRIRVQHDGEDRTWMNPAIYQSYIDYQRSVAVETDLCYASGQTMPISVSSPKYIRYPGDGTKLISSNEKSFIVFRGRFANAREALSLGRETNEKAHAALKWLIRRQAWRNGDQVILAFAGDGGRMPSPVEDTAGLVFDPLMELGLTLPETFTTGEALARHLREALNGYHCRLSPDERAVVMGLDSAIEGKGRLAIFYYREMRAEDFLSRVCGWHSTCTWRHNYRSVPDGLNDKGKPVYKRIVFTGAPSPADIIKAAYGEDVGAKLLKSGVERLLPCVVDGAPIPIDLVKCPARRAAQPGLSGYEKEKALSIACALIRKWHNDKQHKEVWTMALQTEVNDRSYLFGRALAYAEQIERRALHQAGEKRSTNAERLMVAFSKHPAKTWMVLMERLGPYRERMGGKVSRLVEEMEGVIARLQTEGFTNETLSELYCLGYASQKQRFADEYREYIQQKKKAGLPVDPDEDADDEQDNEEE